MPAPAQPGGGGGPDLGTWGNVELFWDNGGIPWTRLSVQRSGLHAENSNIMYTGLECRAQWDASREKGRVC